MKKNSLYTRSNLIGLIGLISNLLITGCAQTPQLESDKIPIAPCSFPFNAALQGQTIVKDFRVTKYRHYIFTLNFYHQSEAQGIRLLDLLDDKESIFTSDSVNTNHPVPVTYEYLAQHGGGTLDEQTQRENKGLFTGEFVRKPTDLRGMIPIKLEILAINDSGISTILPLERFETLGMWSGGISLERKITIAALKPGRYQLRAETIQDSPLFFEFPIDIGVTYHPNEQPLKD